MEPLEVIESQDYLWLVELSEPSPNELTITVSPILNGETMVETPSSGVPSNLSGRIRTLEESIQIDISFDFYFFYRVYNEMYCIPHKNAKYEGRWFRTYKESEFIVKVDRNGNTIKEKDLNQHYQIGCMNHVIDIVSWSPPEFSFRANSHIIATREIL